MPSQAQPSNEGRSGKGVLLSRPGEVAQGRLSAGRSGGRLGRERAYGMAQIGRIAQKPIKCRMPYTVAH